MPGPPPLVVAAMRALLVAALLASGPAHADTKTDKPSDTYVIPKGKGVTRLDLPADKEAWQTPVPLPNLLTPSFGGGWSIGAVIVPPDHPDSAAPPRGMVFEPPDVGDPMAIAPGGSGLGRGWNPRSLTGKFAQGLADALNRGFQLVLPKHL